MALSGKVAFVTGGARGLGKAFAVALLQRGAKVSLVDIIDDLGQKTAKEFNDTYGANKAIFTKCDVTNLTDLRECYQITIKTFGALDIVINNAGVMDENNFEKMIDINLTAVIRSSYIAADHMRKDKGGKGGIIINIASIAGLYPVSHMLVYTAAKHGVVGFSRAMAINLKDYNKFRLSVAALCPGLTDTEMGNPKETIVPQKRPADETMPNYYGSMKFVQENKGALLRVQQVVDGMLELLSEPDNNGAVLGISPNGTKYFYPKRLANKL